MAIVAGARETFGRDGPPLPTSSRLQDVEEGEAYRLPMVAEDPDGQVLSFTDEGNPGVFHEVTHMMSGVARRIGHLEGPPPFLDALAAVQDHQVLLGNRLHLAP